MTKTNLSTVLALIPRSDEQLARDIGISTKTIKRIKSGTYKPSHQTESVIVDYLDKLGLTILTYLREGSYAKQYYELEDYPKLYFTLFRNEIKK